jgi:peptidylprolyl isomerase
MTLLRSTAVAVLLAFALTGCGTDSSPLDKVKTGGTQASPTLTVPKDLTVEETVTRVLKPGSGPEIEDGDIVTLDYLGYNGRTGELFDSSFRTHQPLVLKMDETQVALPGFLKALKGQRAGSRVIAGIPPIDGFAADRPEIGLLKSDTVVFQFFVRNRLSHLKAWGQKQTPAADVPTLKTKSDRPTGFTATATTPAAPAVSRAELLIKGSGDKIQKGGVVVAQYQGHIFSAGKKFDSSWDRPTPSAFSLDGVVPCWKSLLPGVTVGSRVVLECTNADAYGDAPPQGSGIEPGNALIFVVDVLDTYTY